MKVKKEPADEREEIEEGIDEFRQGQEENETAIKTSDEEDTD